MRRERGSALVIAVVFMAVFVIVTSTLYTMMRTMAADSIWQKRRAQAAALADAGVAYAAARLRDDALCLVSPLTGTLPSGSFSVALEPVGAPSISSAVAQSPPKPIDVTSTGEVPGVFPWGSVRRKVTVRLVPGAAAFPDGVLAASGDVSFSSDSRIDSYDSRTDVDPGTFGAAAVVTANGRLVFESTAAAVQGGAYYLSGAAPSAQQVTGAREQIFLPVDAPRAARPADLGCSHHATGVSPGTAYDPDTRALTAAAAVTLSTGAYTFSSLTVGPAGSLTLSGTGRTHLRVDGPVTVQGAVTNPSKRPGDLILEAVRGSTETVTLDVMGRFYGVVLAPEAEVVVSSGTEVLGLVVGSTVTLQGTGKVHFDVSLATDTGNAGLFRGVSGQQAGTWNAVN